MDSLQNSSNYSFFSSMTFRITLSIFHIVLSLAGFIGYTLYAYVVFKHRKSLSNPFYSFTVSMAVPDCITNLITVIYKVPIMISTESGLGEDLPFPYWIRMVFGYLCDYSWFVVVSHMVLIASNRVIALRWSTKYSYFFSRPRVIVLIIFSYMWVLVIPSITYWCSCRMDFVQLSWTVLCDNTTRLECAKHILLLDSISTNLQIAFVLFCNAFILTYVYQKGKKIHSQGHTTTQKKLKREKALILQFTSIALMLIVGQITFWFLPFCSSDVAGFASSIINTLLCAGNPFLYFTFSSEIRKRLWNGKGTAVDSKQGLSIIARNKTAALPNLDEAV